MTQWISFLLVACLATIALETEARAIPAEPISVMLDPYGNPIVFLREKRTPVHPYPQRAMMFTGYYRPVRRSSNGGQATGVFAQGNAVSGEAFFGGIKTPHLKDGPEPVEEPEVSSAEAHAEPGDGYNEEDGPVPDDGYNQDAPQQQPDPAHQLEEQPEQVPVENQEDGNNQEQDDQQQNRDQAQDENNAPVQPEQQPEPVPVFTTETPVALPDESSAPSTKATPTRPKVHQAKKPRKPIVEDVDDDDDEDDDDVDDEPVVPFVPFNKNNKRRQGYPNLNNFFPMVFSFPGVATRAGSGPGSPPHAVTAIANSYSTGKGGVASSMATAYGGSPNGKKRRPQAEE